MCDGFEKLDSILTKLKEIRGFRFFIATGNLLRNFASL